LLRAERGAEIAYFGWGGVQVRDNCNEKMVKRGVEE
jgi:hypothetical protein